MTSPFRILFVCTANICRSPFLEHYARSRLGSPAVAFSSAGTQGLLDHPISEEMGVEMRTRWGLDTDAFRSRRLTADLLDEADLVLTAERRHRQFILDAHPHASRRVLTLGQAVRGAAEAEPSDDIADPYRLGAEAQATATRQMGAMLDALPITALLDHAPARKPAHG
jgi:sulfate adenylyltransferase